jgi:RND family efflux transporter MFP subunit
MVHAGQKVSKGQLLATLDAAAVEQQIKAAEVQLTLYKSLYEKQKSLWEQNIGTEVQLMQAKAQYEANAKQKEALVAQRNMYRIVAPISGTVENLSLKQGDMASPGQTGIRVVSFDQLKVEANLGENYIGKVKTGDPVNVVFPDMNDSIKTKLSFVSQSVDPISRAITVQVKLPGGKKIYPNMSSRLKIANYENHNALVIPVSVIQKTAEGEMVYVVEGGKAKATLITTGRNSNGMVEVLSGLKAGDKVVTEGFADLDNGAAVVF